MSETGKVKWFENEKNFGCVSRADNTEAFIKPGIIPRSESVLKGDELSFDAETDPAKPGRFLAKNVQIINRVPRPAASPPGPATTATTSGPEPVPHITSISLRFGKKINDGNFKRIPIWVVLAPPVSGVPVTLFRSIPQRGGKPRLDQVQTPTKKPVTGPKGEAKFVLYLEQSVARCDLVAKVLSVEHSDAWPPDMPGTEAKLKPEASPTITPTTEPVPTPPTQTELSVKKQGPDAEWIYTFAISARPNEPITVHGKGIEVEARKKVVGIFGYPPQLTFTTDEGGRLELEVRARNEGVGEVFFEAGELKSRPRFIERRKQISGEHNG